MNTCSYRITLGIKKNRTFAAQRLGDQRPPSTSVSVEQHGRVELDELDIADRGTGPQRQCHTVAGGTVGIGGRTVEVPKAAGGQDDCRRMHDAEAVFAGHQDTADHAVVDEHLKRHVVTPDVQRRGGVIECALHLRAGGVAAGVDDPAPGVPAFAGQRPLPWFGFVESGTVVHQFGDRGIAVGHDRAHRDRVTQARTGDQRVSHMRVDRIVGAGQHHRDPALRIVRRGLIGLAQHDDFPAAVPVRGQRGRQTGDAGTDHDDIGALLPHPGTPAGGPGCHSSPPGWPISIIR